MLYLLLYSRSELYSRAETMYLTVGPTGDIFLVITRYIYLNNIEMLHSLQPYLNRYGYIYSPTTNKTTDPINLGLWLFFAFFRGGKRADYLKKGKRLWKTQRFKNAKTVDMTRFLYVCIQRRIIYSPSHYDDMFILNTQAHARLDQMAQQFEVVCNGLNENEGQAIQTMDQSASLIRSNLIQVKEQLEKLAVY